MSNLTERRRQFSDTVEERYRQAFRQSGSLFRRGRALFPNGVAQVGRMVQPYPPYIKRAEGGILETVDGHMLVDLWAGHFCMMLGHGPSSLSPDVPLHRQLGLLTSLEAETAEGILKATGDDQIIFSTSGALATMHATMIASAATKRSKILKVEGGWHGVQPWTLAGVREPSTDDFHARTECAGVPSWFDENVFVVPFNDCSRLEEAFTRYGDQLAAMILELVIGNAGMQMATVEFAATARRLCSKYGVALIIDELVTGFRVRAGGIQELYGIRGDLTTYGKSLSGGMPFACITGSRELMSAVVVGGHRATVDAGTFTAHPGALLGVRESLRRFEAMGEDLFTGIMERALRLKTEVERIFGERGIAVRVTGQSTLEALPVFPIGTLQYILDWERFKRLSPAQQHWDPQATAVTFRNETTRLALILKGIYSWQGLGVVTAAHDENTIDQLVSSYSDFADEIQGLFPIA